MKKKASVHKKEQKNVVSNAPKKATKALVKAPVQALTTAPAKAPVTVPVKVPVPASTPVKPVVPAPVIKKRTLYVEVTPDKFFVLCDGRKVKNAKELADILQLISDDMFKYHVTDTKNDFANWINDVFGEPELAKKIRTVRNRLEMSVELYRNMFDKVQNTNQK